MAKKPTKQPERIRCADCVHGKPHKGSGRMVRDIEHR